MNANRALRRAAVATGVLAGVILGSASVAGAGEPVVQACVGTTFSGAAHAVPPQDLGQIVVGFAQAPGTAHPGLGDGIQEVQAGLVPDEIAVNTCND
jgi:hypothetical protein